MASAAGFLNRLQEEAYKRAGEKGIDPIGILIEPHKGVSVLVPLLTRELRQAFFNRPDTAGVLISMSGNLIPVAGKMLVLDQCEVDALLNLEMA